MTGVLLPTLPLEAGAVGGAVMSKVDNVTTTTANKVVASASAAVSLGRWSNLAIIASFLSLLACLCDDCNIAAVRGERIAQLCYLLLV